MLLKESLVQNINYTIYTKPSRISDSVLVLLYTGLFTRYGDRDLVIVSVIISTVGLLGFAKRS